MKRKITKFWILLFLLLGYGISGNAQIWTTKVPDVSALFYGIGYGNNCFITSDYYTGKMYKSTDNGQTWNITATVSGTPGFIGYGNNTFVATDNNYREYVFYSTDNGDTWTGSSLPTTGISMSTGAITYGNGKFVTCSSNGSTGSIFTSTDAITWSTVFSDKDPESVSGLVINGLCYGNGMYIAVGSGMSGRIFTSTDATTWTSRSNPIPSYISGIAYGNNTFVVISAAGEVIISSDGINWSSAPVYTASTYMNNIAFGNGYFYAVGNGGLIIKSSDGINWTTETSGTTIDLYGIAYGNGNFIATGGDQGLILVQEIAPTVTSTTISTYDATSATMGGNVSADGGFSVSERGVVYSSTDNTPEIGETDVSKDVNGSGTGSFSKSITGLSTNTSYYVRAYATNGGGTSYGDVVSFTTSIGVGLSSQEAEKISIYPNPVVDGFQVNGIENTAVVNILDINGKLLSSKEVTNNAFISVNDLSEGMYVVKITTGQNSYTQKIIKK